MAGLLKPLVDYVIVTGSKHPRALKASQLKDKFGQGIELEASETVVEAYRRAKEMAAAEDLILVTGSLFVVGEVLEGLDKNCL
jgi:dihydrofolate synthase/folylpolyglutamate synthase